MGDPWATLPAELHYLIEPSLKYGVTQFVPEIEELVDGLSEADFAELRDVCQRIIGHNHLEEIRRWQHALELGSPEYQTQNQIGLLLFVMEELHRRGIEPFTTVEWDKDFQFEDFDWSDLPEELQYLIPFAEKYGPIWSEAKLDKMFQEMTEDEEESLVSVHERMRINRHFGFMYAWTRRRADAKPKSQEWFLLDNLLVIFDWMDLPLDFEDGAGET